MDATSKQNQYVRGLAIVIRYSDLSWNFNSIADLIVDDNHTESYIGEIFYANELYETGAAIRVRDWIFYLERFAKDATEKWTIAGLHGKEHCTFLIVDGATEKDRNDKLTQFVVKGIFPILHPEVCIGKIDPRTAEWKLIPIE